jgi:hypothetical protein
VTAQRPWEAGGIEGAVEAPDDDLDQSEQGNRIGIVRGDDRPAAGLSVEREAIKIMSFICYSAPGGMAGHAATRSGMKPSEYKDMVTSGDTGQHEI